jgi:hypothetical protein
VKEGRKLGEEEMWDDESERKVGYKVMERIKER